MDKPRFSRSRIEDHARTADVIERAKRVTNPAADAARDRLGLPAVSGKDIL